MGMLNSNEVWKEFQEIIADLDTLINLTSTKTNMTFLEFSRNLHSIIMGIIHIKSEIDAITVEDRKNKTIIRELNEIVRKLDDARTLAAKKNMFLIGGEVLKRREDIINCLKDVSKQMGKIKKRL